jgi:hypothetical protein
MTTQNENKCNGQAEDQDKLDNPGESMGLAGAGKLNEHNDWGATEAGVPGNAPGTGSAGTQHNDWGHAKVPVQDDEASGEAPGGDPAI